MTALRAGAPLLPDGCYFMDHGDSRADIRPPLDTTRTGRLRDDLARVTQDLAHAYEDLIRVEPDALAPAAAQLAQRPARVAGLRPGPGQHPGGMIGTCR